MQTPKYERNQPSCLDLEGSCLSNRVKCAVSLPLHLAIITLCRLPAITSGSSHRVNNFLDAVQFEPSDAFRSRYANFPPDLISNDAFSFNWAAAPHKPPTFGGGVFDDGTNEFVYSWGALAECANN